MGKIWKTKGYYKKCLKIQIQNNKKINEQLIKEREYSKEISRTNNSYAKLLDQNTVEIYNNKKEIRSLKTKNTRLTNEIKKLKGEE